MNLQSLRLIVTFGVNMPQAALRHGEKK